MIATRSIGLQRSIATGVYAALALLAITLSGTAWSLPGDRDQPIHITADKAIRDEQRGVTIYTGNVEMRQGSMELEADRLTIFHETEQADKIVARGNPAKMRQQPEIDKGLVHAHANVIEYYKNREFVHLKNDARIERDGDLVTGDSIDYFIAKQVIRAQADTNIEGNKVEVVIQPTTLNGPSEDEFDGTAGIGDVISSPSTSSPLSAPAPGSE
ncbi:MAG: lipopolysaccharide transport periplasmic protein LptA [Pseudomonadota bacterium]